MNNEHNVIIQFKGWQIDIFPTEFGKLGLTVEPIAPIGSFQENQPYVDIFVDSKTLKVVSVESY